MSRRLDKLGVLVIGMALCTSLFTILVTGPTKAAFGDAPDYSHSAKAILEGYYPRESPYFPVFRPPLYPLLISTIWRVTGPDHFAAIKVIQAVLFSLTCGLLYAIGTLMFGDRRSAALGAALYGLYPFALVQTADIQTEVLHTLLVAAAVFALLRSTMGGFLSAGWAIVAGAVFGTATLCRPSALPIGLLLCAIAPLTCKANVGVWRRWGIASAGILTCFLVISPWTYLNWRATGDFLLVSDAGGYQLWLGNHPALICLYEGRFPDRAAFDDYMDSYVQGTLVHEQMDTWVGYASLSLGERDHLWREEALRNMVREPIATGRRWIIKVWNYWRPWLLPIAFSTWQVVFSGVVITSLYLLSVIGMCLVCRQQQCSVCVHSRNTLLILGLLFAGSTVVHMLFHSMMRFRLPYVDPYLCLLAALAMYSGLVGFWGRHAAPRFLTLSSGALSSGPVPSARSSPTF